MKHFYSKNDLDNAEKYVRDIIDWCQKNIRKFDFDVEISDPPRWSFFLQPEQRVYNQGVSKEFMDQFQPLDGMVNGVAVPRNGKKTGFGPSHSLERAWGWAKLAEYLNVDVVITGKDRLQSFIKMDGTNFGTIPKRNHCEISAAALNSENGFYGPQFWQGITDIPFEKPFGIGSQRACRVSIYDYLPDELKQRIMSCRSGQKKYCGECLSCLTREVYQIAYQNNIFTLQEIEKIYDLYMEKVLIPIFANDEVLPFSPEFDAALLKEILFACSSSTLDGSIKSIKKTNLLNGNFKFDLPISRYPRK